MQDQPRKKSPIRKTNWIDSDGDGDSKRQNIEETKQAKKELKIFKKGIGIVVSDATGTGNDEGTPRELRNAINGSLHDSPKIVDKNPLEPS